MNRSFLGREGKNENWREMDRHTNRISTARGRIAPHTFNSHYAYFIAEINAFSFATVFCNCSCCLLLLLCIPGTAMLLGMSTLRLSK